MARLVVKKNQKYCALFLHDQLTIFDLILRYFRQKCRYARTHKHITHTHTHTHAGRRDSRYTKQRTCFAISIHSSRILEFVCFISYIYD